MKNKNILLLMVSAFALMFSLAFASATLSFNPSSLTDTITSGTTSTVSFTFNLSTDTNYTTLNWAGGTTTQGSLTSPSLSAITTADGNKSVTGKITNIPFDFSGTITGNFFVANETSGLDNATIPFTINVNAPSFQQYPFCTSGDNSTDLKMSVDISNAGHGDKDTWYPLDVISAKVKFENNKDSNGADDYDLQDVTFVAALYKVSSTSDVIDDMVWISEDAQEFNYGDVDEGKKAEHTFEFKVDPANFDQTDDYYLVVKVKADDSNNNPNCIDFSNDLLSDFGNAYYADVKIKLQTSKSKMVIVDTQELPQDATAQCEQEVSFSANVWNIGNKDFSDKIMVNLNDAELGVDQNSTFSGDLNAAENALFDFKFKVPAAMEEKIYNLAMKVYYDYDATKDEYKRVSDETFLFPLTLSGNCVQPEASISASLESGGKAGEPLVIRARVTNTGTLDSTYSFSIKDFSDWASSADVNFTQTSGSLLSLGAGESEDILITLDVDKKTAEGDYTFNIETISEGNVILTQPVQVAISPKDGLDKTTLAILIALISAAAIAVIIVLIVRASRKK